MRVLVTGNQGYIGTVLAPLFAEAGHDVTGLDCNLFERGDFLPLKRDIPTLACDLRDITAEQLRGFDAIVHLAGISNDPLGDLNPQCTYDINHSASVRLAILAKEAGIPRFLFASSCSLYGAASPNDVLDEHARFSPVTPYGESKAQVERDVAPLADASFSPTFLRCATAFGASPRLRADLVVNNLTGYAFIDGEVLIKSDGTPWRPLVHIEDISRAFLAVLHAKRDLVHNEAFNVGRSQENYQIRDLAEIVRNVVIGSRIRYAEGAGPDPRCYRVDCSKIERLLPEYQPQWTAQKGVEELYGAYKTYGLCDADFNGARYLRVKEIQRLQDTGEIDATLRRITPSASMPA